MHLWRSFSRGWRRRKVAGVVLKHNETRRLVLADWNLELETDSSSDPPEEEETGDEGDIHRKNRDHETAPALARLMAAATGEAARQAVREGDLDAVRAFLDAGIDANLSNPATGRTLLHVACRQGFPAIASLLLSNGANPGAATFRHLTPLHLACHQGHLKIARLLLEAWAPVDDRDEAGTTPLHLSAQMGHEEVVRLLLQCGASKDARDESGWTPIFFACWKGHAVVARILLQAGANARASDGRNNISPLHLACSWGELEVVHVLLEFGADSSAKDCNGAFPDGVIGAGCPDPVDPACARELSEVIVGHRLRIKDASSSLECIVDSLRAKVGELEDQLERAGRDRSELLAYSSEGNRRTFSSALKPECPVCQVEVKEAVLDPCRHLAACCLCASTLESCPLCSCPVGGYQLLESRQVYEHVLALEDELAVLRAQLQRFSRRVRDLVAENGDLKVELGRAKALNLVLDTERRAVEERFVVRSSLLPATSPVLESAPDNDRRTSTAASRTVKLERDEEDILGRFGLGIEPSTGDGVGGDGDAYGMGDLRQQAGVAGDDCTPGGDARLDEVKAAGPGVSESRILFDRRVGKGSVGSARSSRLQSSEGGSADVVAGDHGEVFETMGEVESALVDSIPVRDGGDHGEKAHDTDGCTVGEPSAHARGARPIPSDATFDTGDISERNSPDSRCALGTPTAREQARVANEPTDLRDGHRYGEERAGASLIPRNVDSLTYHNGRDAVAVRLGSDRHASPRNDLSADATESGIWPSSGSINVKGSAGDVGGDGHGLIMDGGAAVGAEQTTDETCQPPEQQATTGKPPSATWREHGNSSHDPVNRFSTESDQSTSSSCSPAG